MKLLKNPIKFLSFLLLLIAMLSIGTGNVFADATYWQAVGNAGFSEGSPNYPNIVVDGNTPYVAYRDSVSEVATVKKFDGASWVTVGNLPRCYSAASVELALDKRSSPGTLYVLYSDDAYAGKATVKKLVGSSWTNVGSQGFSESAVTEMSMVIDSDGTPYIAYKANNTGYVKKFDGANWVLAGSENLGPATDCISLAIDNSTTPHTPYVAYLDWSWPDARHGRATVKKLVGSSWVKLGDLGEGPATYTNLVVDNGAPIIAYRDGSTTRTTVYKFNGSSWEPVGGGIISEGDSNYTNMVLDSSATPGTLYVTYSDNKNGVRATVRKFDGTNWATVGNVGFSADMVGYPCIAVGANGKSYVAYRDYANEYKATVYESIVRHNLTYTVAGNGSISGAASQIVGHGGSGTAVTAVPAAGYHFVSWSDGSTNQTRTDSNLMADKTVSATFAINTYTLTYTAETNGSITGTSPQTVNHGGNGTAVTAVANTGYHFVKWSDNSTQNPRTDINVAGNINVTASFAINTYTLTYTAGANGSITGSSPQTVNHGGNGTAVTAVANTGYHFVKWNDNSTQNPRTDTNITGNINVSASFALNAVSSGNSTVEADKTIVTVGDYDNATITVTLKDEYNNPAIGRTVILSQGSGSSSISPLSTTSSSSGVATFTVTNTRVETVTYSITADSVLLNRTVQVTFVNGEAESLEIEATAAQSAGVPFGVKVTVQDAYGNAVTDYTGTIRLSTNNGSSPEGRGPDLPEEYTFTPADAGIHTFSGITLYNAAVSTLTATDTAKVTIIGTSGNITVSPGSVSADDSTISAEKTTVTADDADTATITVSLKDEYGNPISGESVELVQGDGSSEITTTNNISDEAGIVTFTFKSTKAEQITYTAMVSGKALNQTAKVTFVHGQLEKLKIDANGTQKAGEPFSITVTAQDHFGNTITDYTGTIQFASTDAAAVLPADYTFVAADNGSRTFNGVTLKTAGKQAITATDTGSSSVIGSTGDILVDTGSSYAEMSTVAVGKPTVTADGIDSTTITVTLIDDYGNLVGGKVVTLNQGSGSSAIEAIYGTTGANGIALFNIKSTKAEQITYSVMANGEDLFKYAQVTFVHGTLEKLKVEAVEAQKAGEPFGVTVTAQDHYGNTVTDYTGTIQFTSTDGAAVLPASYTFEAADNGSHIINGIMLKTAGKQAVTVTDMENSSIAGTTGDLSVDAGSSYAEMSTVTVGKPTVTADGIDCTTITVTLVDDYGNLVSGETVTLDQGDGSSVAEAVYATTDENGIQVFNITSIKAEEITFTAIVDDKALDHTVQVNFVHGPVEGLKLYANGIQRVGEAFSVIVAAQDHHGNIVDDYTGMIRLSTNNGSSPDGTEPLLPEIHSFTADDEGTYTFRNGVTLYNAAESTLTAVDTEDAAITGTLGGIAVEAGPVNASESTVAASNTTVTADGTDSTIITVILKDEYGNFVSGETVTLDQGSGSSEITIVDEVSDMNGTATFTVGSTKAEEVTYAASAGGKVITQTATVTFIPGSPEGLKISTGGVQTAGVPFSVTITAQDSNGNTVKDYNGTVNLTTDNGSSPNGADPSLPEEYTFRLSDEGTHTFEDEIILYNAVTTSLTVTDAVYDDYERTKNNIIINPAEVNEVESIVEASETTICADGTDSSEITVILKDAYGNLLSGKTVTLAQGGGSSDITPASAISDADGMAAFTVKSTKAEEVTYTIKVNGTNTSLQVSASFEAGPVDAVHSALTAGKAEVASGGTDSSTITVVLKDAFGNPVSGETVTLDQGTGSSDITTVNGVSGKDGKVSFAVSNANAEAVTYTATAGGVTIDQTITINFLPFHTVKVTASPLTGGTASGGGSFAEGRSVTVTASHRSGYEFVNWTENGSQISVNKVYTFTMGTSDRLLTANFKPVHDSDEDAGTGGGNSGGSKGSGMQQTSGNTPVPAGNNAGNTRITVSTKLDSSTGTAITELTQEKLSNAFNTVNAGSDGVKTVTVEIPKMEGARAYESTLPASFAASGDSAREVEIKTELAEVTVPGNMLPEANAAGTQNVSLTIAAVDKSGLAADLQSQLGSKPIIELNLKIGGQKVAWSNENALVTVSIAYSPTAEELKDPEHITVWYIDGSGRAISVPSGRYDPASGKVTFSTTHFSKYAVVYVRKNFSDIGRFGWAKKQIEVLTSKGIIYNTLDMCYYPSGNIARADYLAMLVKTLGLSADFNANFDDVKSGTYYYKEIGIARKLGITTGTGNNKFNPDSPISRQDMMVMTVKALSITKKLKPSTAPVNMDSFDDKAQIAAYASESIAAMVKTGLIEGSGKSIMPLSYTSRAEAAVLLYRIYNFK